MLLLVLVFFAGLYCGIGICYTTYDWHTFKKESVHDLEDHGLFNKIMWVLVFLFFVFSWPLLVLSSMRRRGTIWG